MCWVSPVFFMKMMNGGGQRGLGSMYTQRPRANITSYTHTHTRHSYLYLVIYVNGWLGLEGRFTRMSLINSRRRCQTTLLSAWLFLIYSLHLSMWFIFLGEIKISGSRSQKEEIAIVFLFGIVRTKGQRREFVQRLQQTRGQYKS